jgi:hypothetical protein
MPSKWSDKKDKFPKFIPDLKDNSSQRIMKLRRELDGRTRQEIEREFKALRNERDSLKEALKNNYERLSAHELYLLDWSEEEETPSWKDQEGWSFREQPEPYVSVEDKEAFDRWAEANGWKAFYTINHQTLNANVKPLLEANMPLPDGLGVYMKNKIVLTKPR